MKDINKGMFEFIDLNSLLYDIQVEEWCTAKYKKVMCIETGIIYPSIEEAVHKTGFKNISNVCNGKFKTCGGFHLTQNGTDFQTTAGDLQPA